MEVRVRVRITVRTRKWMKGAKGGAKTAISSKMHEPVGRVFDGFPPLPLNPNLGDWFWGWTKEHITPFL